VTAINAHRPAIRSRMPSLSHRPAATSTGPPSHDRLHLLPTRTTVNVRYSCVLLRSVCAGQVNCSVMIGTVR
jgi:hypothetical protein